MRGEFEFRDYATQSRYGMEIIGATLFDTLEYYSDTTVRLDFFQRISTGQKTNMYLPGMLPNPHAFLIRRIAITGLLSPMLKGTGMLEIGQKHYGINPLWRYTLGSHNRLIVNPPLYIAPLVNFRFTISWNLPVICTTEVFGGLRYIHPIEVCLIGEMARPIQ